MALTDQQKLMVGGYFMDQAAENEGGGVGWLVDFFLLTLPEQNRLVANWATAKRAGQVQAEGNLEADKASAQVRLTADIANLDAIINR